MKEKLPAGVDVSNSFRYTVQVDASFSNSSTKSTSCFTLLPRRSNFQTVKISPDLNTSNAKSNPGRPCLIPEIISSYILSQPAFSKASFWSSRLILSRYSSVAYFHTTISLKILIIRKKRLN